MTRSVVIHQPNYLPWIGLFSKVCLADCFIIYDCAQYTTHGVINRNKIRSSSGPLYLTIPVNRSFRSSKINEVLLPENNRWQNDHWQSTYVNYAKSLYFKDYQETYQKFYQKDYRFLCQLNIEMLEYLLQQFNIKPEIYKSSELGLDPGLRKTEFIVEAVKKISGDTYISGPSGKDYLDAHLFTQNNLVLKFFAFQHPVYKQRYPGFEPNLAAVDLLFNTGPEAEGIIKASGSLSDF